MSEEFEAFEEIDAPTLKSWLSDNQEIALIDVREPGQFGEGHLFFAVPIPYSRFELELPRLAPNLNVRMVLNDDGDGIARRAGERARALGYANVKLLKGGVNAWRQAGFTLYAGVNLPSKTFGELIEHARHTPRITAEDLEAMRKRKANFVVVDGRPFAEYQKMTIPGSICCPNGELPLRIKDIAPDPKTKIVVNCAGRTRSIIGAQTLIDFGVENEVVALENGTQGWFLAGLHLDHGAERRYPEQPAATTDRAGLAHRARALALKHAVTFATAEQAAAWLKQPSRTTFLLDVRAAEEVAAASAGPSFVHAPGGQLVQATDNWVGVKGARLLLADADQVRAPVIAAWLRQLGHEAVVLEGGLAAAQRLQRPLPASPAPAKPLRSIEAGELAALLAKGTVQLIDLRPSMTFRKGHIAGAKWSIRPRMAATVKDRSATVVLVSDDGATAALAAVDLGEAGISDVRILAGGQAAWLAAGHPEVATPNDPPDTERIDFLFFTAKRHDGDREAAQQYLAWEQSLIGQLDAQERGVFRIE